MASTVILGISSANPNLFLLSDGTSIPISSVSGASNNPAKFFGKAVNTSTGSTSGASGQINTAPNVNTQPAGSFTPVPTTPTPTPTPSPSTPAPTPTPTTTSTPTPTSTPSPTPTPTPMPAPGSAFTPEVNQAILRTLFGYNGEVGQGQAQDILARNPEMVDKYVAERRKYQPDYQYNPATVVPAKDALNAATSTAQDYVTNRGLDYNEFAGDIDKALQQAYKSVPYGLDTNASSYFDPNLAANVLDEVQTGRRTKYQNDLTNLLPENFLDSLVPSTMDDSILGNILNEQYNPAVDRLKASRARGLLNDTGYNAAVGNLDTSKTAANARLQDLGGSVLEGLRTDLGGVRTSGLDAARNYTLGQTYDPNTYKSQIDTKLGEGTTGLEGKIRSVLGGEELFNIPSTVSKGQVAQGVSNNRGLLDALSDREKTKTNGRGLGTQGSF